MRYAVHYYDGNGVRWSMEIDAYSEIGAKVAFKICHPLRRIVRVEGKGTDDVNVGGSITGKDHDSQG